MTTRIPLHSWAPSGAVNRNVPVWDAASQTWLPLFVAAADVVFDNTGSGLAGDNLQDVIDEIEPLLSSVQVVLLESYEDEGDVPPETPVGAIIFQKAV